MTVRGAEQVTSSTIAIDEPPRGKPTNGSILVSVTTGCVMLLIAAIVFRTLFHADPSISNIELVVLFLSVVTLLMIALRCLCLAKTQRRYRMFAALLVLVTSLPLARITTLQGLLVPVRVLGPSMAPGLQGAHFETVCFDCQFPFSFDATSPSTSLERIVCPNCGKRLNSASTRMIGHRGARVLVDRLTYAFQDAKRFDVIAAKTTDGLVTKRVMGLPGEQITLRRGELFINERWHRKSLDQLRRVALLVHDSAFAPRSDNRLPERWTIESTSNASWKTVYHSWRCYDNPLPRTAESPVSDHDSYNQGHSRTVNHVRDLFLRAQLILKGNGVLRFEYHGGNGLRYVAVDLAANELCVGRDKTVMAKSSIPGTKLVARQGTWEFAAIDGQILLALNGETLVRILDDRFVPAGAPGPQPLAIVATNLTIEPVRLQVYRDIHYLDALGQVAPWTGPRLQADEYLLLGDNVPISRDSRHWGAVPRNDLLGKVVRWR